MTATVRAFTGLNHPYPLGVDVSEFRWLVLGEEGWGGGRLAGRAGYAEATVHGPAGSGRARLVAALALQEFRRRYSGSRCSSGFC